MRLKVAAAAAVAVALLITLFGSRFFGSLPIWKPTAVPAGVTVPPHSQFSANMLNSTPTAAIEQPQPAPGLQALPAGSSVDMDHKARVTSIAPSAATLRDEVARNPHQPPLSLVRFAMELGERLRTAEQSEDNATQFFSELEDCVMSAQPNVSTQSLCLSNADRLARKFAALKERDSALRDKADPEVRRLAK